MRNERSELNEGRKIEKKRRSFLWTVPESGMQSRFRIPAQAIVTNKHFLRITMNFNSQKRITYPTKSFWTSVCLVCGDSIAAF